MFNILSDPLISIVLKNGGGDQVSLPRLYELLKREEVDSFPRMRAHQAHAWHAFLVQLGVIATHRTASGQIPSSSDEWRYAIADLTDGAQEPWCLVVDDFAQPAFLQPPPDRIGAADEYNTVIAAADGIDVLVNAKNHDFKKASARQSSPEDWLFALVSLQTTGGFSGRGHYGISRMNGGVSSRAGLSLGPYDNVGAHVMRDISILLQARDRLLTDHPMTDDGTALLWTLPWNGTKGEPLALSALDPFYIEICSRVRLRMNAETQIEAVRAIAQATRLDAKKLAGVVGDPWTPVHCKKPRERRALTLSEGGFTYRRLLHYLTDPETWEMPLLLRAATETELLEGSTLVARSMVRGQGKTAGWHERAIPLSPRVVQAVHGSDEAMDDLRAIAKQRLEQISTVQRILSFALQTYSCGGDASRTNADSRRRVSSWLRRLDNIVDRRFFADLNAELDASTAERAQVRSSWLEGFLVDRARDLLHEGIESLPCASIHRYKAHASAVHMFEGRVRQEVLATGETATTEAATA